MDNQTDTAGDADGKLPESPPSMSGTLRRVSQTQAFRPSRVLRKPYDETPVFDEGKVIQVHADHSSTFGSENMLNLRYSRDPDDRLQLPELRSVSNTLPLDREGASICHLDRQVRFGTPLKSAMSEARGTC